MAEKRHSSVTEPAERVLVITRVFDAPRELVWKAWTEPERVKRWWGPKGFTAPFCKIDLRVGGVFLYCMRSPEGKDYWNTGVYREIVEPERLVFTYAFEDATGKPGHETLVTVTFVEHDGKTKLTMHQAIFESVTVRDAHGRGWIETLDRLAAYLAKA